MNNNNVFVSYVYGMAYNENITTYTTNTIADMFFYMDV